MYCIQNCKMRKFVYFSYFFFIPIDIPKAKTHIFERIVTEAQQVFNLNII